MSDRIQLKSKQIVGDENGPHLLITGGVHGDEFEPMAAVRRLIRELSRPYDLDTMQLTVEFYAGVAETTDLLRQDAEGLITNAELALAGLPGDATYRSRNAFSARPYDVSA